MRKLNCLFLIFVLSCALPGSAAKLRQVAMIDLPGDPGFNQVAMANGQVVISRPGNNTIEIFSPVKRRVIARISQIDNPRGLAVDDEGGRLFVALAGSNRVAVIDTKNWQVQELVPVQHKPEKLLWVPQTKTLYMTSTLDRTLSVVDARAGESSVIELNGLPQDMIYDPGRRVLLLSLQDLNQVAAIGPDHRIAGTFKLMANEPTGLALDNAHRRLYVAVRYAVVALNADTGQELSRVAAPGGTDTLILDAESSLLYAAAGDGSVLAIDTNRNVVDHELPTNVRGYSIAYDPSHKMLFMPGGREGRSKMVILRPVSALEPPPPATAQSPAASEQTAMRK